MLHPNTIYELRVTRNGTRYKLLAADSSIVDAHWKYERYEMLSSVLSLLGFTPAELLSLSVRLNSSEDGVLSQRAFRGSLLSEILGVPQPD
jgi:hypothetical protein